MTNRFIAHSTPISGLTILERHPLKDERGVFERLFCDEELRSFGHPGKIAQANRSITHQVGTVRGMHFQHPPHGEWKLLTCLFGAVHDVIVDLRRCSPTFLHWHAVELTQDNARSLLVPPGCAHGFQVLKADSEMLYFHSHPYTPTAEAGLRTDDPRLKIHWPIPISMRSPRDAAHPLLSADWQGINL